MKLEIWPDSDCENPCDWDCTWKIHSFSSRHINNRSPDEFLTDKGNWNFQYARKADVGLCFALSYFEHGGSAWSIIGEGMQCPWDSVRFAGVAVWGGEPGDIGGKTYDERMKDLRQFLETYNAWCNGECCGWSLIDDDGEIVESCGGYYGSKDLLECFRSEYPEYSGLEPEYSYA